MNRYTWLMILGLVAAAPVALAAQELTLDQAVLAALSQNAALRASRAASTEATANVTDARSGFFPRASFTESWQRGDQPVFVFSSLLASRRFAAENFAVEALNHPDPVGYFHSTLAVEQTLFDGGRRRASVDAARLRREVAVLSTDQAAAGLALATTLTFGRILTAQSAGRAADAGVAAVREDLARAERRRDAGMATDADVLALAVSLAGLQQRAIQAAGDAAVARAELNHLMGAPIARDFQVLEPPDAVSGVGADTSLELLLAEADRARPELLRAAAGERLAETARRQARSAFVPQVVAQAAYDVSGTRVNDRAGSWLAGGELRWTFSTGGAEHAQARGAAAAMVRARAETDEARSAVHVEVVTALRRLEAARARQASGLAAVAGARESQRIIRDRFDAGMAGVNDVLRASTAVLDAETQRMSAKVDAMGSEALLKRALGRTP